MGRQRFQSIERGESWAGDVDGREGVARLSWRARRSGRLFCRVHPVGREPCCPGLVVSVAEARSDRHIPYRLCEAGCRRGTELAPSASSEAKRARWCTTTLSGVEPRGVMRSCRSSRRQGMEPGAGSAGGEGVGGATQRGRICSGRRGRGPGRRPPRCGARPRRP